MAFLFARFFDTAKTLPEPQWHAMLSILGRCEDGERLAHEWSSPCPGYTFTETQKKLRHALGDAGPVTCGRVMDALGQQELCNNCLCREFIKSPISFGCQESSALVDLTTAPTADLLTESQAEAGLGAQVVAVEAVAAEPTLRLSAPPPAASESPSHAVAAHQGVLLPQTPGTADTVADTIFNRVAPYPAPMRDAAYRSNIRRCLG